MVLIDVAVGLDTRAMASTAFRMVRAKECSVIQMQNVAEAHPKAVDSALVKMAGKEMGEIVSMLTNASHLRTSAT